MTREIVFRGATILTIDAQHRVLAGDVAMLDGAIVHVGDAYTPQTRDYDVVDCSQCVVMPGLVQAHVHTCQTLARGRADDMELLDWLRQVVWPYEAALDESAARASAELACAELLLGGTTAILDMGTVHHTDRDLRGREGQRHPRDDRQGDDGRRRSVQARGPARDDARLARRIRAADRALARQRRRSPALRLRAALRAELHRRAVARGRRAGGRARRRHPHAREREHRRDRARARALRRQGQHRRAGRARAAGPAHVLSRTASISPPPNARCSRRAARTCARARRRT